MADDGVSQSAERLVFAHALNHETEFAHDVALELTPYCRTVETSCLIPTYHEVSISPPCEDIDRQHVCAEVVPWLGWHECVFLGESFVRVTANSSAYWALLAILEGAWTDVAQLLVKRLL